MLCGLFFRAL